MAGIRSAGQDDLVLIINKLVKLEIYISSKLA